MTIAIDQITILAVGLIGGSLAKALKANGFSGEIVGWGRREVSLKKGLELGVIDRYSLDLNEAVKGADLIVVATPTLIAADMIKQLVSMVDEHVIITDVASVKGNLLVAAKQAFGKVPPNLVLGHPIAGSEQSGVDAAKADLFVNHRVILTPTEETNPDALQAVKSLWESTGADLVEMPVDEHDEVLAATSHLPHILAYTLVDALAGNPEQQNIFRFAAGGFRDFTRIASSDPTMWHEISLANRDALLKMIDTFSDQLGDLRQAIADGDSENIVASFTRAKSARDKFAQMLEEQQK
ncbi:prephenate dehydrogenase/arogenate dehydrogenase family protein [Oceanicoccus sagamiensis]|uniref:prephenate dehydrogenase n=1 Tax=Oceanicoccus sagamiensis TaxID=716816 RepID=A0A1X9N6P0_9GAMM|nr:prephenate dehydrogenase/arogenate dehydrogenase family protein [Oceanicoccus sagamiensis]ARN72911.1 prephenate dehydrogenase [Oceanicoccus sagamiensis]